MTLSNKLLIWFSITSIVIASVAIGICWSFFRTKQQASEISADVNSIYFKFLKLRNTSNDFFAFETINSSFYKSKQSSYLQTSNTHTIDIKHDLNILAKTYSESKKLKHSIEEIKSLLNNRDSIFATLSVFAVERGFKDYGLIGQMRHHAHKLENNSYLNEADLLTLRRREKDYLLRHEHQYISSFKIQSEKIKQQLIKRKAPDDNVTAAILHLNHYTKLFSKVVYFDQKMGLHDNGGLKGELNKVDLNIENQIKNALSLANYNKDQRISQLEKTMILTTLFALLICFFLANILSRQITKPLSKLTILIEGIKLSNFKQLPNLNRKINTQEIKVLYKEFGQMIDQLKDYQTERDILISKLTVGEKKYREMADSLPQGLFETDSRGVLIYVNKVWEESFGYTKQEAEFNINVFDVINRRKNNNVKRKRNEVLAYRKDESWFPGLLYIDKIIENGQLKGWRGVIVDISERYEYIKLLRKEQKKAKESDRLKTAFLANISHEIRTPINAIMGFSSLLKNRNFTPNERQVYHDIIEKSSHDLLAVFEDMITVSRIESDDYDLNLKPINLDKFKEQQIDLTTQKLSKGSKENLEITYVEPEKNNIRELIIDTERVKQVLDRLTDNAIKFTNTGSITLGHKILKSNVIFFVKDSGIGIPEEKHQVIFDPFRQVDESHSKTHAGTGLGLAICKGLINQMDGNIWIESSPGKGAGFYFSIPYKVPSESSITTYKKAL